jgi:hypothetical protein
MWCQPTGRCPSAGRLPASNGVFRQYGHQEVKSAAQCSTKYYTDVPTQLYVIAQFGRSIMNCRKIAGLNFGNSVSEFGGLIAKETWARNAVVLLRMKKIRIELTVEELQALVTLTENQFFRMRFLDPKIPGYKARPEEMKAAQSAVATIHKALNTEKGFTAKAAESFASFNSVK